MTTVLTTENLNLEPQEAADDRFFFYGEGTPEETVDPRKVFAVARSFSASYSDLLPEGAGQVLLSGRNADGELVPVDDPSKHKNVTLYFDKRQENRGRYLWQLTEADAAGREVRQLQVTPTSCRVTRFAFDTQGRLQARAPVLDVGGIAEQISALAHSSQLRDTAKKLREARANMEQELSTFLVVKIGELTFDLYERELAKKQKLIDHLGFVALKPLTIPDT